MYKPRTMRRIKQLLSEADTVAVLERNLNGILSLIGDEGYPYGVPMSYAYADGKIYLHSAKQGHKIDAIQNNNKVSFTVVDEDQIIAEEFTTYFRSAICFGAARIVETEEEMLFGHKVLCDKYSPNIPMPAPEKLADELKHMYMIAIDIEAMTGKEAIEFVRARG